MAHHPISRLLQAAFAKAVRQCDNDSNDLAQWQNSRRKFIKNMALSAGALGLMPPLAKAISANPTPDIAIVGAGMAGLNAAYQLQKQGVQATIYEASNRVGGRMFTRTGVFGKNISTDIGGEFVDTTHLDIIELVKEMDLSLLDLRTDPLVAQSFYFDGQPITEEALTVALKPYVPQLVKDITSLPDEISYLTAAKFAALDQLSIAEYLHAAGISGWLYNLLNMVLTREYGMEITEQSAINFLIMFDAPANEKEDYRLFGEAHEVLKIKGGSMQLTNAIEKRLTRPVNLLHLLTGINADKDGRYTLRFLVGGKKKSITADYIITAIPFTILRTIELNMAMPAEKKKCIMELGYGNSSKFILGMKEKPWRMQNRQGYTFTDISFGCGWDSSQHQQEGEGSFTVFGGGDFSDFVQQSTTAALEKNFVSGLETIYPGATKAYTGQQIKYCWAGNPFSKAAYSSMKKGQWSTLAGWEAIPVGNIHFAGEQVSLEFQGYMNGAAKSGRMAAAEILQKIIEKKV
jgi:monoamine oxidase